MMERARLHRYARISPHSWESIDLFSILLENSPQLSPILWVSFSPHSTRRQDGSPRDESDLKRIAAALMNRLSRRTNQTLFPLLWFSGVENTEDDPRIHFHLVVMGEKKISPDECSEVQPRERLTRKNGSFYWRKAGRLVVEPYYRALNGINYCVNHHFPLKFDHLFFPHGKKERRQERFEPFIKHLRKSYEILGEESHV